MCQNRDGQLVYLWKWVDKFNTWRDLARLGCSAVITCFSLLFLGRFSISLGSTPSYFVRQCLIKTRRMSGTGEQASSPQNAQGDEQATGLRRLTRSQRGWSLSLAAVASVATRPPKRAVTTGLHRVSWDMFLAAAGSSGAAWWPGGGGRHLAHLRPLCERDHLTVRVAAGRGSAPDPSWL